MCGRAALTASPDDLRELFELDEAPEPMPARYNIAPSQPLAVVRDEEGRRLVAVVRWGMHPRRAPKTLVINTRAEATANRGAFKEARRCLVPIDGFYEWSHDGGRAKQPYFIRARDRKPLALGALWERPDQEGDLESCIVITMPARAPVAALHDRMPLLVPRSFFGAWLDREWHDLQAVVEASRAIELEAIPVGTYVNNANNEGPECLASPAAPPQKNLF